MTRPIGTREMAAAMRVLASGRLSRFGTRGPSETQQFESALREAVGSRHALAVNSGTSALICALVGAGVGPGDEVLVPAYTWVSTAAAPLAVGAVPVLVEVDASLMIDPVDIKRKITRRTKAIIPVHMLNLVCDMDSVMRLATEHDLVVIEDACQAVGVRYHGRRVGTIGHAGAFSFNQHKNIKSGEGGAVVTSDDRIYARAGMYHDVGFYTRDEQFGTDEPVFVGQNLRMPELSSAILRTQLRRLDAQLAERHDRREYVLKTLARHSGAQFTVSPHHDPDNAVGLTVSFDDPDEAAAFASARGVSRLIDTGRHVYTNWQSIISRRTAHPRLDPYKWAEHDGDDITEDTCPQTLEVLARTCSINLMPELPMTAYRAVVRLMARS
jgi:dTDP-4-amino-4,6-dideoxygalactose transaminase